MKANFIQLPSLEGEPRYCRADRIAEVLAKPPNPKDDRYGGCPFVRIIWTQGGSEDFPFASQDEVSDKVSDLVIQLNAL